MKKYGLLVLILSLLMVFLPQTALAAEPTIYEQDLSDYLGKVSIARGFDVTKDDLIRTLTYYDLTLDDFMTVEELDQFLGDVIAMDSGNLNGIYEKYDLDQVALTKLLSEYGETLNDYVYVYDLKRAVYFYTNYNKLVEQEHDDAVTENTTNDNTDTLSTDKENTVKESTVEENIDKKSIVADNTVNDSTVTYSTINDGTVKGGTVTETTNPNTVRTIKGGELPKTAGNHIPNAIYGMLTAVIGFCIYRKVRNA